MTGIRGGGQSEFAPRMTQTNLKQPFSGYRFRLVADG